MRIVTCAALAVLLFLTPITANAQQGLGGPAQPATQEPQTDSPEQRSKLADATVIAFVIAASVAAYKAMNKR
jgi:hypothetical protein